MYDMKFDELRKGRISYLTSFILGLVVLIFILVPFFQVFFSDNVERAFKDFMANDFPKLIAVFLYILASVIFYGGMYYLKTKKYLRAKKLNETGKLIKNVPYKLASSDTIKNGHMVMYPVVEYKTSNGEVLTLIGEPRYDLKDRDADGYIDIVIDEKDPKKCFMDFEINRLSGNLDSDYLDGNKNPLPPDKIEKDYFNVQGHDKLPDNYHVDYDTKKEE